MDKSAVATRKDIDDVLDVIKDLVARFDERFKEIDVRFERMEARFDKRFDRLDKKVDYQKALLESRVEKIETDNTLIKRVLAL